MNKVEAIERDVQSLSPDEPAAFRSWFLELDADAWDRDSAWLTLVARGHAEQTRRPRGWR
jgi:hypothetical protein